MKLSPKTIEKLNNACIARFGMKFDDFYHAIEQNLQMKEELKRKEKELKKLKGK